MWRWALVFAVVTGSAAEAGQVRSSFQVGLTITGRVSAPAASVQTSVKAAFGPLPRRRPAAASVTTLKVNRVWQRMVNELPEKLMKHR